ncbi:MBL fold metallo-hydrolase [Streptomyces sp. NPDC007070]|uniref:MBL fold metallo-hydrolase n=1 Tax=Streptomyces sp. NPDC007070 TaxID=3154312 RepID=UPI0033C5050D
MSRRLRAVTLASSVAGAVIVALDGTVLTVAQPRLQRELDASYAQVQWTSTGYLIAVASLLVFAGRLGDLPHGLLRGRRPLGHRRLFADPYLTRFPTGLFDGAFDPRTRLRTDPKTVDAHIGRPELVLVSHSHWDHLSDVPHIAKTTGARVVGTETTYHLLVSLGVDAGQISVVKGGEVLDFGGITVEVVPSLHSRNKSCSYFAPGTLHDRPARTPRTIADLPEGDTLAFQVTAGAGGPSAFLMGASDFSERAVSGLRPDLAMVAVPTSTSTPRYVPRLLRALGTPGVVVPVHWDDFELPLTGSPVPDPAADLDAFLAQVREVSPATRVVRPDYRTVYDSEMRPAQR